MTEPHTQEAPLPSADEVFEYFDQLSNWGRWGPDDARGTLNFVTPGTTRAAAAEIDTAAGALAALVGGERRGVVWTSGATESINLALKGVAGAGAQEVNRDSAVRPLMSKHQPEEARRAQIIMIRHR